MAVRRASSQLLSSRSVHLRIVPRPANLSESREIYRVLQRFGEISTYKSLRFEYHNPADNIALAIYRDQDAAQQALDASPIRFALEQVAPNEPDTQFDDPDDRDEHVNAAETPNKDGIDEMLRPSHLINRNLAHLDPAPAPTASSSPTDSRFQSQPETQPPRNPSEPPMPFEPADPSTAPKQKSKWFQVTVDRSRAIHQDFVERQPYWKQFSPMKSMAQEDLAKSVPHAGLSDVSKRPPGAHRTPTRVLKKMNDYVEHRMVGLTEMYEEGARDAVRKQKATRD